MIDVIIIEDDLLISEPISRSLGNWGYRVNVARDGVSGLEIVLDNQPDLVILDIMLPKMD